MKRKARFAVPRHPCVRYQKSQRIKSPSFPSYRNHIFLASTSAAELSLRKAQDQLPLNLQMPPETSDTPATDNHPNPKRDQDSKRSDLEQFGKNHHCNCNDCKCDNRKGNACKDCKETKKVRSFIYRREVEDIWLK